MLPGKDKHGVTAICYLDADRTFAHKLRKFLVNYKLPAAIAKLPAGNLQPDGVICCPIRLSGDLLTEKPEFVRADYLILVCSQALSEQDLSYLNYDLRTFMEEKREAGIDPAKRIIPVAISGTFGEGQKDCCPLALKAMGADCPEAVLLSGLKSERNVFLYVISRLLGLEASALCSRRKRYERTGICIAAALLVFLIVIGLIYVRVNVEFRYHYLDFTMRYGVPVGIRPLSAQEQERTAAHYVITKKNGRVISLEYVDAYGRRIDHDPGCWRTGNRPSAYLFEYDSTELSAVTYEDRFGRPYFVMEYNDAGLVHLKDAYDRSVPYCIGQGLSYCTGVLLSDRADILLSSSDLGYQPYISGFSLEYSDEGYVTKVLFLTDGNGTLCGDYDVYGIACICDNKGRVIQIHYLDAQGDRTINNESVASVCYGFNDEDCYTDLMFLDKEGELTSNGGGDIHLVMAYDGSGNRVSLSRLNRHGVELFYAEYKRDERGNLWRANSKEYIYDDRGYVVEERWLDPYGLLTNGGSDPVSSVRYIRDEMGNVLVESYYDADGNPAYTNDQYGMIVNTYNHFGQLTSRSYRNAEGTEQVCIEQGYSTEVTTYDDRGRITSVAYFGTEGQPVVFRGVTLTEQYHKMTVVYEDGLRQKVTTSYWDDQGRLVDMMAGSYACMERVAENGEILLMQLTRSDGSIYSKLEQELSVNGRGEREVVQRQITQQGTSEMVTVYRPNGVPFSTAGTFYNTDGRIDSALTITYFEGGAKSSELTLIYDDQGKPAFSTQLTYDKYGEIVQSRIEQFQ